MTSNFKGNKCALLAVPLENLGEALKRIWLPARGIGNADGSFDPATFPCRSFYECHDICRIWSVHYCFFTFCHFWALISKLQVLICLKYFLNFKRIKQRIVLIRCIQQNILIDLLFVGDVSCRSVWRHFGRFARENLRPPGGADGRARRAATPTVGTEGVERRKKFIFSLKPKSVGSARDTSLARKLFLPIKIFFFCLKISIFCKF